MEMVHFGAFVDNCNFT